MSKIWGLRWDDREFKIGDELPKSHKFDMGNTTDEMLDGTSVVYISGEADFIDYLDGILVPDFGELDKYNEWINKRCYDGNHIYLVSIDSNWGWEWGEDESEIVMNGPVVVRILK